MEHDIDPERIDAYLNRSARLRSQAFTALFVRFGRGIRRAAGSLAALVS